MSLILAMSLFALSMSISPGPVNVITLSTGVNHGFRSAMPFVSGATIGFTMLLLFVGFCFGQVVTQDWLVFDAIGYGGTAIICYMGYKIATATPEVGISTQDRPKFSQGFLLQWLNPKAWIACFAGISGFKLTDSDTLLILFVALYFVICYLSIASWALVGARIKSLFEKPRYLRLFNLVMGGMLILLALYLLVMQHYSS